MVPDFNLIVPVGQEACPDRLFGSLVASTHTNFQVLCPTRSPEQFESLSAWQQRDARFVPILCAEPEKFADGIRPYLSGNYTLFLRDDADVSAYLLAALKDEWDRNEQLDILCTSATRRDAAGNMQPLGVKPDQHRSDAVEPIEKAHYFKRSEECLLCYRTSLLQSLDRLWPDDAMDPETEMILEVLYRARAVREMDETYFIVEGETTRLDFDRDRIGPFLNGFFQYLDQPQGVLWREPFLRYRLMRALQVRQSLDAKWCASFDEQIVAPLDAGSVEFYVRARFEPAQRQYINELLKLDDDESKDRVFPEPVNLIHARKYVQSAGNATSYFSSDFLDVLSWNVGLAFLGVNRLGYGDNLVYPGQSAEGTVPEDELVLSAHGPSSVRVHVKRKIALRGMINGTGQIPSLNGCRFSIYSIGTGTVEVGVLYGPLEQTDEVVLEPGLYDWEINTPQRKGCHSLWHVRDLSPVRHEEISVTQQPSVAIVTFAQSNEIGSLLQCYALQSILEGRGYRVSVLNYGTIGANCMNRCLQSIIGESKNPDSFARFRTKLNLTAPVRARDEVYRTLSEFDAVIVGGDQVWNPRMTQNDPIYRLAGLDAELKKIVYSASFGIGELPAHLEKDYREAMEQMSSVFVREQLGVELAEKWALSGVEKVLDPILLVSREFLSLLEDNAAVTETPYILLHLEEPTLAALTLAATFKSRYGCEIVFVPSPRQSDFFLQKAVIPAVDRIVAAGPSRFLGLLANARMVITDSYYTSALALTYQKPFYVFAQPETQVSTNGMILELLRSVGREDVWIEPGKNYTLTLNADFTESAKRLDEAADRSMDFLFEALPPIRETQLPEATEPSEPVAEITETETAETIASPEVIVREYPNPDFTVVSPMYNQVAYAQHTISSIMNSTYKNFRLVVSDNCSTDGTTDIIRHWAKKDSRIIALYSDENKGMSGNTKKVSPYMLETRYAMMVDGDDMISPYCLEIIKTEIERHDVEAVFFEPIFIDAQNRLTGGMPVLGEKPFNFFMPWEKSYFFCKPAPFSKIYTYEKVKAGVMIDERERLISLPIRAHGDVAGNSLSLFQRERLRYIPNRIYYHRIHDASVSRQMKSEIQLDAVIVYRFIKEMILRNNLEEDYMTSFLRYKLNHLYWLYGALCDELKPGLVQKVLDDMDRNERNFYRHQRFTYAHREFLDKVLGLSMVIQDGSNYYAQPLPVATEQAAPAIKRTNSINEFEDELMVVHSGSVGADGSLGINQPGLNTELSMPKEVQLISHKILGAPCPSSVRVSFKKSVLVSGFLNGSSPWTGNSNCRFAVSGQTLGILFGPGDRTDEILLEPGTYELTTEGLFPKDKHSAWAVKEYVPQKKKQTESQPKRSKSTVKSK